MTRVKRFYYVAKPEGRVKHLFHHFSLVEGSPTACGIRVQKGWFWWSSEYNLCKRRVCKRCERAW